MNPELCMVDRPTRTHHKKTQYKENDKFHRKMMKHQKNSKRQHTWERDDEE